MGFEQGQWILLHKVYGVGYPDVSLVDQKVEGDTFRC